MKGLLVGAYTCDTNGHKIANDAAKAALSGVSNFEGQFNIAKAKLKKGKARVLFGSDDLPLVAVASLGSPDLGYNEIEERDEKREAVCNAMAAGLSALFEAGATSVTVDPCGDPEAAAEGAFLSQYVFDHLKSERKEPMALECLGGATAEWNKGKIQAEGQNFARYLTEMPANMMTPTIFAKAAGDKLKPLGVEVIARDKAWAEGMKMGSFLSVAQGSEQPPIFLEMTYNGGKSGDAPVALVGKGITFDAGGISLKVPSTMMNDMRADMGGGAVVVGTIFTLASLKVPINVKGLVPLTENMINGKCTKVADVVYAMNGKSIQIMNTDAEGRLALADALCYADTLVPKPKVVVDIATLTGSMMRALGTSACGVFSNSTGDWEKIKSAGSVTGDRVWRMPLWEHFADAVVDNRLGDVCNIGKHDVLAGNATAAAFLQHFTKSPRWMHMDMAGVMSQESAGQIPYLCVGATGRPARTLCQYVASLAKE